jgi:hypothetical protein
MTKKEHWSVKQLRELRSALSQYTNPMATEMMTNAEDMEGSDLYFMEVATFFSPEPIGLAHIYQRAPYTNPEAHKERLIGAAERGWLDKDGDSAYVPSEKGGTFYGRFIKAYKEKLAEIESLTDDELGRIEALLSVVVNAAKRTTQVRHRPALELSLKEPLDPNAASIQRVQLLIVHLLSYRDDAHVASWSPHKLEGITWESFSDVWQGKVANAAELIEKRPFRGYELEDYAAALEELAGRGWIKEKEGSYIITEEGRRVREEAEELTNQYYDAAWVGLSNEDIEELKDLFQKLAEKHEPEKVPA